VRKITKTQAWKDAQAAGIRAKWQDPVWRAAQAAKLAERNKRMAKDTKWIAANAAVGKANAANPAFAERIRKGKQKGRDKTPAQDLTSV